MKVQLVSFDDLVQYIVDGKMVYEIKHGDPVATEHVEKGKRVDSTAGYTAGKYPFYRDGYFGFRMVGTHYFYSNFRVHRLIPVAGPPAED
ncbi:MAG: hypothetical protein ACON5H_11450 [Akkermansiaceae bacterium]